MRRPYRAFSLLELMVVIGIIAVLIALLMPVLKVANDSARAVRCSSQLRQIGQGIFSYAAIHRGFRVYDRRRIEQVFPAPRSVHYFRKEGRDAVWRRAEEAEIQGVEYEAPSQPLPVDAVAVLVLDK